MQSFTLEPFPTRGQIHILLYKNVSNAAELRKRLLSHDQELSYAFIDAKMVNMIGSEFLVDRIINNLLYKKRYLISSNCL